MNWTGPKIWATITHDHELKISKNISQIHELNWTEMIGDLVHFFPSLSLCNACLIENKKKRDYSKWFLMHNIMLPKANWNEVPNMKQATLKHPVIVLTSGWLVSLDFLWNKIIIYHQFFSRNQLLKLAQL